MSIKKRLPTIGTVLTSSPIEVTPKHVVDFQDFMGHLDRSFSLVDHNHHVNEEFASQHMYGGLVGDGHQTLQYIWQVITDHLPPGSMISGHSSVDIRLVNPTRPGDTVVVSAGVKSVDTDTESSIVGLDVSATNQRGSTVAFGQVSVFVPPETAKSSS